MERVNIPGEVAGTATYYMGNLPEAYGDRLYDMERYEDMKIAAVVMDGAAVASREEFERTVNSERRPLIGFCEFLVRYENLDLKVHLDFRAKRLRVTVEPEMGLSDRKKLAVFLDILTEPDYYEAKEKQEIEEELHIPDLFGKLQWLAITVMTICFILQLIIGTNEILLLSDLVAALIVCSYWTFVGIMKRRIRRKHTGAKSG